MRRSDLIKDNKCFFCRSKKSLVVHHLDTDRLNNKSVNLIILCVICHNKLHVIYRKLIKSGIYKRISLRKMPIRTEPGIIDIKKIKKQYRAGISIRALSHWWDLPYATLYRRLKNIKGRPKLSTNK